MVTIREVDWDKVDNREEGALDNIIHTLFKKKSKPEYEWIEAMAFSPPPGNDPKKAPEYLAIGNHNNYIYLLDTKKYSEKKMIKVSAGSSFVTALDWTDDAQYLRTVTGAYELTFVNLGIAKILKINKWLTYLIQNSYALTKFPIKSNS